MKITKYLELNEGTKFYCKAATVTLKAKFIALIALIYKTKLKRDNLIQKLTKDLNVNKLGRKINNKKTYWKKAETVTKTITLFFENINKIDKPRERLIKKEAQINNTGYEKGKMFIGKLIAL